MGMKRKPAAPSVVVESLGTLVWEGFGWTCDLKLPEWSGIGGKARVRVAAESSRPPSAAQVAACQHLADNLEAIGPKVLDTIFAMYRGTYRENVAMLISCAGWDEGARLVPLLHSAERLGEVAGIHTVHVQDAERDGLAYVGFELGCTWEDEHGLGVVVHGQRVVDIGQAALSFDGYAAYKDKKRPKTIDLANEPPWRPRWNKPKAKIVRDALREIDATPVPLGPNGLPKEPTWFPAEGDAIVVLDAPRSESLRGFPGRLWGPECEMIAMRGPIPIFRDRACPWPMVFSASKSRSGWIVFPIADSLEAFMVLAAATGHARTLPVEMREGFLDQMARNWAQPWSQYWSPW